MKEGQKGLITDFDNTLVKTMQFVSGHIDETCKALNINCPNQDKLLAILKTNPPFEQIFQDIFASRADEVLLKYRETAMEKLFEPTDNGLDVVNILNQNNILVIIVSNRINKLPERLEQAGYKQNSFLAIVQPDESKPSKNAYSKAIRILKDNNVTDENIFIVGDSLDDYAACPKYLENHFFSILTGPNTEKEFIESGVKKSNILEDISSLPNEIINYGRN